MDKAGEAIEEYEEKEKRVEEKVSVVEKELNQL